MLNFLMKKLETKALPETAAMAMKTAWKPLTYDNRMASFLGESGMCVRTRVKASESRAIAVGKPEFESLVDMVFWKMVPASWERR